MVEYSPRYSPIMGRSVFMRNRKCYGTTIFVNKICCLRVNNNNKCVFVVQVMVNVCFGISHVLLLIVRLK